MSAAPDSDDSGDIPSAPPLFSAKAAKSEIRREMISRRRNMGMTARQRASDSICDKIIRLPEYAAATTIAAFSPMAEEVNLWKLFDHAMTENKTIALPRIDDFPARKMTFHRIHHRNELRMSEKGINEPPPDAPTIKNQLFDFLLIPALAIDSQGNRLGYGGGFYDIFLSQQKNIFSCAPVFTCQFVAAVPAEAHDIKINLSITE